MKIACIALAATIVLATASHAGPGHDHGHGGAAPALADVPRLESVSQDFELVAVAEGHKLTIYLDAPVSNEPIDGATIEVVAEGHEKLVAKSRGDGVYEIEADWVDQPGVKALVFTVMTPSATDLLNGTLDVHGPEAAAKSAPLDFKALLRRPELWVWSAIVAALGFFLSFAFRPARAPFDDPAAATVRGEQGKPLRHVVGKAAALAFIVGVSLCSAPGAVLAGPGHDHGDGGAAPPAGGNVPRRQADGAVVMPKPSQRLLRIRTSATSNTTAPQSSELLGTVVADPRASGRVQAPFAGRVEVDSGEIAFVGQRVAKDDVLATIVPTVSSVERGSVGQQLAEIDGNIAQAAQKVTRLGKLVGSVPQAEIDQAKAELDALRERRKALSPSLFGKEQLRAPVAGIVSAASVRIGQVVDAREILFEIVDPDRLLIEAVGFASFDDTTITGAHAVVATGKSVPLKFLGRAPELKQQSLPLLFKVEEASSGLPIGRSVRCCADQGDGSGHRAAGGRRRSRPPMDCRRCGRRSGPKVHGQGGPHRAARRSARAGDRTGSTADQRIVVEGAELINQVR